MVGVWVAGKTVRSPRSISERLSSGASYNRRYTNNQITH